MHRNTNRITVVGDRTRYSLTHPPRGIGSELVAASVFKLVHSLHQTQIAFLNEVRHGQAAIDVTLGNRDDQA